MFLLLADRLAAVEDGALAVVRPAACMGAPSARLMWEFLLERFHLETAAVSHDPQRIGFSEDTSISEGLFVMRRRNEQNRGRPTRFVRFTRNPGDVAGALAAVDALESGRSPTAATMIKWPRERLLAGDWLPARFVSEYLIDRVGHWFTRGGGASMRFRWAKPPMSAPPDGGYRTLTRRAAAQTGRAGGRCGTTTPAGRKPCGQTPTSTSPPGRGKNTSPTGTGNSGAGC